jgi:hypothetical protein
VEKIYNEKLNVPVGLLIKYHLGGKTQHDSNWQSM